MKNFILFAVLLILASCSGGNRQLREKIMDAVTSEKATAAGYQVIPLATMTDFEWEKLYFFDEGTDNDFINNEIGFKWDGSTVPGQHRRLLFVNKGQVASYLDYDYTEFPLTVYGCEQDRWVYPRNRAQFASFKYCQDDKEIYTFIPVQCIDNLRDLMQLKCPENP
ncbi:hypothetical protein, partial [Pontibacter ruber]